MDLAGRVALITGASRGLGKAMALALAPAGVRLALVARSVDQLTEVAAEARALGTQAEVFGADIADEATVLQLERDVIQKFGPVDILINNAGINIRKFCVDYTLAEWNSVMTVNLTSVFLLCRSFVPHMKGRGYGRVINMTSIMSHIALAERTAYWPAKPGCWASRKALALELVHDGITVVAISPGPFATEMTEPIRSSPEKSEVFMSHTPMRRWGDPKDIGQLALFLCSENASFITGSDILIDGGWCAE